MAEFWMMRHFEQRKNYLFKFFYACNFANKTTFENVHTFAQNVQIPLELWGKYDSLQ